MSTAGWKSTPVVAWTTQEGPGDAPRGAAPWTWFATAGALGAAFATIMVTDALCPEHKAWIDALCTLALVCTITAITGLIRGWSSAPMLAIAAGALGMAIGSIDAAHEPVRGGLIVTGFVIAQVLGFWLSARQVPLRAWDRRLRAEATFVSAPHPATDAAADSAHSPERERIIAE